MNIFALLVFFTTAPGILAEYVLQSNFSGITFFDNFNFYNSWDPTIGFVHYVDRGTAEAMALYGYSETGSAKFGPDHTGIYDPDANLGRPSLRLESFQQWTHGLFIVDLAHMPSTACGTWPAMWTLGGGPDLWPTYGEIDIIEYTNLTPDNLMALHTKEDLEGNCTVAGSGQSGTLLTNDCSKDNGTVGCYSSPKKANTAGTNFNAAGGGVYAMEWTSVAIRIWLFPRGHIPAAVTSPNPDPSNFGIPDANFEGGCDIDKFFFNHTLIFNIEFCGSWAGPTFVQDGCPALNISNEWSSCNMYVAANPQAYVDSYFEVNYVHVYTTTSGSPFPPSSVLSSVLPVPTTGSATSGGAEGQTTSYTQSLLPPTTSSVSSSPTSLSIPSSSPSSSLTSTSTPPAPASTSTTSSFTSPVASSSTLSSSPLPPTGSVVVATTTHTVLVTQTVTPSGASSVHKGPTTFTIIARDE